MPLVEFGQGELSLLVFGSYAINKCPFYDLLVPRIFTFLCFLLVISLFTMAPKYSAEVLCCVSKHENFDILSSPRLSFLKLRSTNTNGVL